MPCQLSLGKGPLVVMLPGWGFSYRVWIPVAEVLAADFEVQLWDLPGFATQSTAVMPADLDALLVTALPTLPDHAHYVGWSLGGLLAQAVAQRQPQRVRSLITVGSSPHFLATDTWPGVATDFFHDFAARFAADPVNTLRHFALLCLGSRAEQKTWLTAARALMLALTPSIQVSLQNGLTLLANSDLRGGEQVFRGAHLALCGSKDPLCPINPALSQTVLANVAHLPMLTHAEQTTTLIRDFLYAQHQH